MKNRLNTGMPRSIVFRERASVQFQTVAHPVGLVLTTTIALLLGIHTTQAANQSFAGDGSALSATTKWSAAGTTIPFTTSFTTGNVANFGVVNGTGTGGSINVAGINVTENFTITAASGTIGGTASAINPITVSSGKIFDAGTQGWTTSSTVGFSLTGPGVFATAGGTFGGGFVLNSGTLVAKGVNAMGAASTLTINGGTIAGSATRDFSGKYANGITVGGNFQLGALTTDIAVSASAANLTFSNTMAFGAATRTVTIGANGAYTLGGTISGTSGTGLTVGALASTIGVLRLAGTNTYDGVTTISGGTVEVSVLANGGSNSGLGSSSNAASNLILNGGNLSYVGTTAGSTDRNLSLGTSGGGLIASGTIPTGGAGAASGNFAISGNITASGSSGAQTLALSGNNGTNNGLGVISGAISNGTGTNVTALTKSGTGKWTLSGANTYTGVTTVSQGNLTVTNGTTVNPTLAGTSSIAVNSGGTLLLSGAGGTNSKLNASATVSLSGGKIDVSGATTSLDQAVSTLTLSGNSSLDFGALPDGNTFRFAASNGSDWTGATFNIYNYTQGKDHLFFGMADSDGLTSAQLNQITFYMGSDNTSTSLGSASFLSGGAGELTITSVPEPSTIFAAVGVLGLVGWRERKRFRRTV